MFKQTKDNIKSLFACENCVLKRTGNSQPKGHLTLTPNTQCAGHNTDKTVLATTEHSWQAQSSITLHCQYKFYSLKAWTHEKHKTWIFSQTAPVLVCQVTCTANCLENCIKGYLITLLNIIISLSEFCNGSQYTMGSTIFFKEDSSEEINIGAVHQAVSHWNLEGLKKTTNSASKLHVDLLNGYIIKIISLCLPSLW